MALDDFGDIGERRGVGGATVGQSRSSARLIFALAGLDPEATVGHGTGPAACRLLFGRISRACDRPSPLHARCGTDRSPDCYCQSNGVRGECGDPIAALPRPSLGGSDDAR